MTITATHITLPAKAIEYSGLSTAASSDRLTFTLFIALAFHGLIIFGIDFSTSKPSQSAPSVTVTLATRDDKRAPEKTDFLAETNQIGSGTIQEAKEITTDVIPPPFDSQTINDTAITEKRKASILTPDEQKIVTSTRGNDKAYAAKNLSETQGETSGKDASNVAAVSAQIASLKAKLALQRQTYAKIPRERILTSVSTLASSEAAYLNKWTQKIEFMGNQNFPEEALQKQLTGRLRLEVIIRPDGSIFEINLKQSSGRPLFDQAAQQIVRQASPFLAFPADIKKNYDRLVIIRTWHFSISGLTTSQ